MFDFFHYCLQSSYLIIHYELFCFMLLLHAPLFLFVEIYLRSNFVGGCFMHGHMCVRKKKQSTKVGEERFTLELHPKFLDGSIRSQSYI
jgi:hypothetical protein